jgi:DNA-binding Xre family transcriptional regulator
MPLPKPTKDEEKKDFLERCHSALADEFKDDKQRHAVCEEQWRKKKNMKQNFYTWTTTSGTWPDTGTATTWPITDTITTDTITVPALPSLTIYVNSADFKYVQENGTEYLVAPVVAIKEGVLNGEFVPASAIAQSAPNWEGIPLTVGHPQRNGNFVGVSTNPEVLEEETIGVFKNVDVKEDSLVGELWIDVEKIQQTSEGKKALGILETGGNLEVSTGYFAESVPISGFFNGNEYGAKQRNITPDHLALLPSEVGACNWEDGCGAPRVNDDNNLDEEEDGGDLMPVTNIKEALELISNFFGFSFDKSHEKQMEGLRVNGDNLSVLLGQMIKDQTTSDRPRRDIIKEMASQAGITKDKVKEILNGDVEFIPRRWLEGFAQALDMDLWDIIMAASADSISFIGDNLPAFQDAEDAPAVFSERIDEEEGKNKISESSEEVEMENTELVDAIINSDENAFAEEDRETLQSLDTSFLEKLGLATKEDEDKEDEPEVQADHDCKCGKHVDNPEEAEEVVEEEVVDNQEETEEVTEEEPVLVAQEDQQEEVQAEVVEKEQSLEDYLNTLPEPFRNTVESAIKLQNNRREALIAAIRENSEFTEEDLASESIEKLEKLAALAGKDIDPTPDYSGQGGPRAHVQEENTVPPMQPIVLAKPVKRDESVN